MKIEKSTIDRAIRKHEEKMKMKKPTEFDSFDRKIKEFYKANPNVNISRLIAEPLTPQGREYEAFLRN